MPKLTTELEKITVEGRGFSRYDNIYSLFITFENGYKTHFGSFVAEVSNNQWASFEELKEIRKTSSLKKKALFVDKYADKFISVPGRSF